MIQITYDEAMKLHLAGYPIFSAYAGNPTQCSRITFPDPELTLLAHKEHAEVVLCALA